MALLSERMGNRAHNNIAHGPLCNAYHLWENSAFQTSKRAPLNVIKSLEYTRSLFLTVQHQQMADLLGYDSW